jgi:peptide/nickel transport system permease protein
MPTYLLRRSIQGFMVLAAASFFIYTILTFAPGGPLDQIKFASGAGRNPLTERDVERIKKLYKLDKPWPLNYVAWLFDPSETTQLNEYDEVVPKGLNISVGGLHLQGSGVLTGDFGRSLFVSNGMPVVDMLGARLGTTLILMVSALLVSLLIAFPIGIISAVRQYSKLDYAVTTFSFVGLAMPSFWLALMLIIFLAVIPRQLHDQQGWNWLPYLPTGNITDIDREGDVFNRIYHLVLPVSVLAFINVAGWSRFIRASMLEVLKQDYVRTAWAKGLAVRKVIVKHALRNALIPVITLVALTLPGLVQGAIITEAVFAYAGLGRLYLDAVTLLDYPLAMAFLMLTTFLVVVSNLLADVLYALADPRIAYN